MRKIAILLAGMALMATSACNTVRGASEDAEAAADAVDEAATGDAR